MKVIDIHTHGIGGSDTRSASVDAILRIAEMHGAVGVSEVVLSIYSAAIPAMRDNMAAVKLAMDHQRSAVGRRQSAVGERGRRAARITGVYLEGPFLNPARCGALDPASFLEPRERVLRVLIEGFEDVVKVITIAPELNGAPALIRRLVDRGIIVSMGHSDATYSEAEKGWHAGARSITHLFNGMRSIHHREPGIAGFALSNREIYVEVIADPFHLHPAMLHMIFSMKRPERILVVSDSVRETRIDGRGRAVADAHGALLGGSITVVTAAEHLMDLGFDQVTVKKAVSANPARYLRP